jgi:uncharacterized HAD superfamily protein/hypoxanthine phosphoribosyltransferase
MAFKSEMNFRNFNDLGDCIRKNIDLLPNDISLIIGIPRSGMVPAYMIGLHLNVPVIDLASFLDGRPVTGGARFVEKKEFKKILIVDDSIQSGSQLKIVKEKLANLEQFEFKYLAIYGSVQNNSLCDYCFEIVESPRAFEWNILHAQWLFEYACVDIDGVLCEDPSAEDNDDGDMYKQFLLNAPPKYLPKSMVLALVTSRLEKYRPETETWLKKHNVQYKELIMLDLPDKETRMKLGNHAIHKAKHYLENKNAILFIESSKYQSDKIFEISKKPVFSVEGMIFFRNIEIENTKSKNSNKVKNNKISYSSIRNKIKRQLKKINL